MSLARPAPLPGDRLLLSWAGLRGAVPIVLATVPADDDIFNLVFVLVVVFTLVQAPTLPWVARRLGLPSDAEATQPGHRVLAADPAGRRPAAGARRRRAHGWPASRSSSCGCRVGAAITLVVRDGQAFVPTDNTPLRVGDDLILVAVESVRSEVERRLRAVSRGGRLAGWKTPRRR